MILAAAVVGAAIPFTLGMEWLNANKVAKAKGEVLEDGSVGEKSTENLQGPNEKSNVEELRKEADHAVKVV